MTADTSPPRPRCGRFRSIFRDPRGAVALESDRDGYLGILAQLPGLYIVNASGGTAGRTPCRSHWRCGATRSTGRGPTGWLCAGLPSMMMGLPASYYGNYRFSGPVVTTVRRGDGRVDPEPDGVTAIPELNRDG